MDTYRLKRQRAPVREVGNREDEDSLLEDNTDWILLIDPCRGYGSLLIIVIYCSAY